MIELASFLASDECAGKTQAALAMIKDGLSLIAAKTALQYVKAEVAQNSQTVAQVISGATAEPLKSVEKPELKPENTTDAAMKKLIVGAK
jgi:hypothetical protein